MLPPVALALSATLALSPYAVTRASFDTTAQPSGDPEPDPSWGEDTPEAGEGDTPAEGDVEAPTEGETTADAPTEGTEPAEGEEPTGPAEPTVASEPAPVPMVVEQNPRPIPIPKETGLGLMITAGALGAMGWGIMGWRMAIIGNGCKPDIDENSMITVDEAGELFGTGIGCAGAVLASSAAYVLQALPGAVNWGLAPGAGTIRGKYDAARYVENGAPKRKEKVWIGVGAGLLAGGIAGRITVAVLRIRARLSLTNSYIAQCIPDDVTLVKDAFACYTRKNQLHFFGQQVTSSAVAAGGGMLAYGVAYKVGVKNYYDGYKKVAFSVSPDLGLDYNGIRATLRF